MARKILRITCNHIHLNELLIIIDELKSIINEQNMKSLRPNTTAIGLKESCATFNFPILIALKCLIKVQIIVKL